MPRARARRPPRRPGPPRRRRPPPPEARPARRKYSAVRETGTLSHRRETGGASTLTSTITSASASALTWGARESDRAGGVDRWGLSRGTRALGAGTPASVDADADADAVVDVVVDVDVRAGVGSSRRRKRAGRALGPVFLSVTNFRYAGLAAGPCPEPARPQFGPFRGPSHPHPPLRLPPARGDGVICAG